MHYDDAAEGSCEEQICGHQSQDGGAKHDARDCETVTVECPCRLSQQNPLFTATPRRNKKFSIQTGARVMHCDHCVKDGHMDMTIKYEALY